ncbi:helix-turn-helix transcriptional regulator [Dactylosporangium sp. NPDC005572]|uniref:helix-turn-helix domain-containing protein n=1 Tax=Dactylosporangium sp. NPDC005572 TaxID=3156889 RepID=UPI0033BD00BA
MPAAPDARRDAWARFVKRVTDNARTTRGWTVPMIAEETKRRAARGNGVSVSPATIYRWINGEWETSPSADAVEAFCDTNDIPVVAAFAILWPGKTGRAKVPEPMPIDPDFETLLRRLQDPNVSEAEKYHIRETIRTLAARPASRERPTGS